MVSKSLTVVQWDLISLGVPQLHSRFTIEPGSVGTLLLSLASALSLIENPSRAGPILSLFGIVMVGGACIMSIFTEPMTVLLSLSVTRIRHL